MENQIENKNWINRHPVITVILSLFCIFIVIGAIGNQNSGSSQSEGTTTAVSQPSICDINPLTLKQQVQKISYKQLIKDPTSFTGDIATFTGQIAEIEQSGDAGVMRLSVTNLGYGIWNPNDVIFVTYHQATKAVQDDIVTITGKLTGTYSYTSQANYQITIPSMDVCSVGNQPAKNTSPASSAEESSKNTPAVAQPVPTPTPTPSISCSSDSQCGTNALTGSPSCQGNAVYQNYITYTCNKAGTPQSYCSNSTTQQLQQTCNTSQTCSNGTCNTVATWHTAYTYNSNVTIHTPPFSLEGTQQKIDYTCSISDSSNSAEAWFNGAIKSVSSYEGDVFASIVTCPTSNSTYEYSLPPGQYYLDLSGYNSSYTITVEDYY